MKKVQAIPKSYHTITPVLTVKDGVRAIEFYKKAFGAKEHYRMLMPNGKGLMHAELEIGDSVVMLNDEMPGPGSRSPKSLGATSVGFYVYVKDVDAAFKRAVDAGAKIVMPLQTMFWGDRTGMVTDPSGHMWTLATHVEDLSSEEMHERAEKWICEMEKNPKKRAGTKSA